MKIYISQTKASGAICGVWLLPPSEKERHDAFRFSFPFHEATIVDDYIKIIECQVSKVEETEAMPQVVAQDTKRIFYRKSDGNLAVEKMSNYEKGIRMVWDGIAKFHLVIDGPVTIESTDEGLEMATNSPVHIGTNLDIE